MSELKFIETTDETIYTDILEELENGVGEPLYPGDERRIFGDTMAKVIVTVYNTVNDACRQKMLRYARGTVLDALGENRDVIRLDPTYATTTLRFTVTEAVGSNIIIPAGLRVTGDFVHYFLTDTTAVLYAGTASASTTTRSASRLLSIRATRPAPSTCAWIAAVISCSAPSPAAAMWPRSRSRPQPIPRHRSNRRKAPTSPAIPTARP